MSHKGGLPKDFTMRKNFNYVKELVKEKKGAKFDLISIDALVFDVTQPRKFINEEKLAELSESIKQKGVLEPIIVYKKDDNKYQLISGERRVRASIRAGLSHIPAVIKENLDEKEIKEIQLIENLQREDITPLERAEAIRDYLSPVIDKQDLAKVLAELEFSPQNVSKEVTDTVSVLLKNLGKSLRTLRRWVSLLSLPDDIKEKLKDSNSPLTARHIEELLKLKDIDLIKEVINLIENEDLSTGKTKEIVKTMKTKRSVGYKSIINYVERVENYLTIVPRKKLKEPQKKIIKEKLLNLKKQIDKTLKNI